MMTRPGSLKNYLHFIIPMDIIKSVDFLDGFARPVHSLTLGMRPVLGSR